jgi:hypothetical protein
VQSEKKDNSWSLSNQSSSKRASLATRIPITSVVIVSLADAQEAATSGFRWTMAHFSDSSDVTMPSKLNRRHATDVGPGLWRPAVQTGRENEADSANGEFGRLYGRLSSEGLLGRSIDAENRELNGGVNSLHFPAKQRTGGFRPTGSMQSSLAFNHNCSNSPERKDSWNGPTGLMRTALLSNHSSSNLVKRKYFVADSPHQRRGRMLTPLPNTQVLLRPKTSLRHGNVDVASRCANKKTASGSPAGFKVLLAGMAEEKPQDATGGASRQLRRSRQLFARVLQNRKRLRFEF